MLFVIIPTLLVVVCLFKYNFFNPKYIHISKTLMKNKSIKFKYVKYWKYVNIEISENKTIQSRTVLKYYTILYFMFIALVSVLFIIFYFLKINSLLLIKATLFFY